MFMTLLPQDLHRFLIGIFQALSQFSQFLQVNFKGFCLGIQALLRRVHYNIMESDTPVQQWIDPEVMIKLLKDITQEFKEESYNLNKVVRDCMEQYGEDKRHTYVHDQIMIFSHLLGGTPRYFLELLNEEIISSQTHIITLNSRNAEIAKRLFSDFAVLTKIPEPQNFQKHYKLHQAVIGFTNIVAKRMSSLYQKLVSRLSEDMQKLTQKVKKSRMMNNFLLFKILRELSEDIKKETIQTATNTMFRFCQSEVIQEFYRYTINKFETVKLFASIDVRDSLFEPSPIGMLSSMEKSVRVEMTLKEAVRDDGKYAIFVKLESSHPELKKSLDDYLLFIGEEEKIRMINCKTVRRQWYIIGNINYNFKLEKMAREYLVEGQFKIDSLMKKRSQPIQKILDGQPLQNFTNLDGIIGRCLFLIKKYNNASDFFKDLSKRAILSKSLQEIMMVIPIIGFLIVAGSFSKAFYTIFSNKFSTDSKKLSELTGFVIKTGATVGTSIVGALVGQALIPIPIVGALVGTVVGGLIGQKGCREVTSMIEQSHFDQLVNYFRTNLISNSHWQLNDELYKILDIKKKEFLNYIPKYMETDVFVTIIGFVVVCFHESTRLVKFNQEKEKIQEEKEKNKKKIKKSENGHQREKEFEDQVNKLTQSDGFNTEFDLNSIIQYLQDRNGKIYDHYDVLEKSILSFLSKIIP